MKMVGIIGGIGHESTVDVMITEPLKKSRPTSVRGPERS